ncbi:MULTISPECIES: Gfo/Idh/MocA family protein [Halolamina]|uniref:Predicted dehydrogenase n=1 Tax=Halolamina pelagica TaxID=699431 RepID=A0A1I5MMW7_9EURY|nr:MULTISPECIES: Gfo/Idh/MocA family oxidoreductase [Halolamina]NHX36092.1 Gfo/Idh/MocA family oxidoreductase [Halolamina sp. R1-12]SFP10938.1 Predicted dehydrogenase [Halolamina pelagica]
MYNVAIVGCGVIGHRLADAFSAHEGTTVWGACDLVASKVESFAEEYDCAAYTDYETIVAEDAVDVVYVGVPPTVHREVVEAAIDAEKAVICEKPIAEDATVGAELVALEESTDRPTAINLPFRYTPGVRELIDRVDAGEIGESQRIELTFRFPQWPREWQDVEWLAGREQGGPLREVGTHYLFGVQEAFGAVDWVNADIDYTAPDRYEESITGYFGVEGIGGTIDLLADCGADEQNSMTVVGTEGSLTLLDWYRLAESAEGEEQQVVVDDPGENTLALVDEFVAELDSERRQSSAADSGGDLVSFAEANRVQEVVDAIFASEGERVVVDTEA